MICYDSDCWYKPWERKKIIEKTKYTNSDNYSPYDSYNRIILDDVSGSHITFVVVGFIVSIIIFMLCIF